MGTFRHVSAVAAINLRTWLKDTRVRFLFLCIGCFIMVRIWPFTSYGLQEGRRMTPWLLPFLLRTDAVSILSTKIILHTGMILLLCNAPFLFPTTPYIVLRSKRNTWWMGECLYIMEAAMIYILFIATVSFIMALPVITLNGGWGNVFRDIAVGDGERTADAIRSAYDIKSSPGVLAYFLDPLKTQIYSILSAWATFSILGLLMYLISLIQKHAAWGMAAAGILVFADPLIGFYNYSYIQPKFTLISPVLWTDAGLLRDVNIKNFLTVPLVAGMYAAWIIVLCIGICFVSRRITIEVAGDEQRGE